MTWRSQWQRLSVSLRKHYVLTVLKYLISDKKVLYNYLFQTLQQVQTIKIEYKQYYKNNRLDTLSAGHYNNTLCIYDNIVAYIYIVDKKINQSRWQ